jgi:pyrophosphatase PpaX
VSERRFDCFLVDWDGCLAATLTIWMDLYQQALARRGIVAPEAQIVRELFNDWTGPARFGVLDAPEFAAEIKRGLSERVGEVRLYSETAETLRGLRRIGSRIAILTASVRRAVEPVLAHEGLQDCVDLLLTVEDVEKYKPDPEVVEKALAHFQEAADRALIVGDSPIDVRTGRNAGVASALYYPQANRRFYDEAVLRAAGPELMLTDLRELLELAEPCTV